MSHVAVRAALETALNGITPALATAWANTNFTPTADPYQIVKILFADPDSRTLGVAEYWEQGYMQVRLMYPLAAGTETAGARAELIRSTFKRGSAFASSGITTKIRWTPSISGGQVEDGRWAVIVKIPFYANITA